MRMILFRLKYFVKYLLNPRRWRFFLDHGILFDQDERQASVAISRIVARYDQILLDRDRGTFKTDEAWEIYKNGYILIHDFLPDNISDLIRDKLFAKSNVNSAPLLESVVFKLLSDDEILSRVAFDYLGSRARLDYATAEISSYTTSINSNMWHFDVGGVRLKAFLALNDMQIKGGQGTGIIPRSHRLIRQEQSLYGSRYKNYHKLESFDGKSEVHFVKQPKGSLLLFDTNGWHRACYDAVIRRQFVEFGFADKLKSDELGGGTSIAHSPNEVNPTNEPYPAIVDARRLIKLGNRVFF
jgi:hypothetical protein